MILCIKYPRPTPYFIQEDVGQPCNITYYIPWAHPIISCISSRERWAKHCNIALHISRAYPIISHI